MQYCMLVVKIQAPCSPLQVCSSLQLLGTLARVRYLGCQNFPETFKRSYKNFYAAIFAGLSPWSCQRSFFNVWKNITVETTRKFPSKQTKYTSHKIVEETPRIKVADPVKRHNTPMYAAA